MITLRVLALALALAFIAGAALGGMSPERDRGMAIIVLGCLAAFVVALAGAIVALILFAIFGRLP